jgi:prophage regulatory protein
MVLALLKRPEVRKRHLLGDSSLYEHIRKGLFTPPIKTNKQTSAWPEHESDAIICARIAGASDDELRELVKQLVANRAKLAERITA